MTFNSKVAGAVLAAVLALAATAPAASATAYRHHSELSVTILTVAQEGQSLWTFDSGTFSCGEATYTGTQTGTETEEVSVSPSYAECTAFGFLSVPIDTSPCLFRIRMTTKEGSNYEAVTDIFNCERMTITAPGCTVTIFPQTGLKTVTLTNQGFGTGREVTADLNITGIQYEEHNKGFFPTCAANTVVKSNGTLKGSLLFRGETSYGVQRGIWVE